MLKRGIKGRYIHVSKKHLQKYLGSLSIAIIFVTRLI